MSQLFRAGFWFPRFRAEFGGPAPTHSPTPVGSAPCSWEVTTLPEGCHKDRPRRPVPEGQLRTGHLLSAPSRTPRPLGASEAQGSGAGEAAELRG